MIECRDFPYVIESNDSVDAFFYCDPPYVGWEKQYQGAFNESRHRELARALSGIKGRAMVTYYPHPLIKELYDGWHKTTLESVKTGRTGAGVKERSFEIVLTNYEPVIQESLFGALEVTP